MPERLHCRLLRPVLSACVFCTVFTAWGAYADTLVLKNGTKIYGRLEDVGGDVIYLKIPKGRIGYERSEVQEIRVDDNRFNIEQEAASLRSGALTAHEALAKTSELTAEEEVRFEALVEALIKLNDEEEDTGFNKDRQRTVERLAALGTKAGPALYQRFVAADGETAPYLLAALVRADPRNGAVIAQEAVSRHKDSTVRQMAVQVLAENPSDNVEALSGALSDEQGQVRLAAIEGIAGSKDPRFAPQLADILERDLPHLREAAARALSACTGRKFDTPDQALEWFKKSFKPF